MIRLVIFCFLLFPSTVFAQKQKQNLIYIDKNGVVRYSSNQQEAAFFGVNYTVPFAYGYRSHQALGVDIEKAIRADVHHMWRMGLNAFRVHVWDVEISDSAGNLLNNEHLRLFDFLIAELKKRDIKILVTPIAFWGNGYPEKDEQTPGFSTKYGKRNAVVEEGAIKAQENYLRQFFTHVNPYTKLTYRDDPDIIATEINNEPQHSGPKERTTEYINRLYAAIRSTGWSKPIFYNISESPAYADAIVRSKADGYSFQWYPAGLVANREQKGNFLPHVDQYRIPFGDTIPAFKNKPLMVYEFDAGDVGQSYMYPAMARSYRGAGFWWATQFAYDPMATAYGNTEYQTHFLNLVYTPSKAISLMIAAEAFRQLPPNKSYGSFPADTLFGAFRLSYHENLGEMNIDTAFYYSGTTTTLPRNWTQLRKVAGVGSSAIVKYKGKGAYFLDKIEEGIWRLEVYPDAITVADPYAKASPRKEVVRLQVRGHEMELALPGLQNGFSFARIGGGNVYSGDAETNRFTITPGVYLLTARSGSRPVQQPVSTEFFIPRIRSSEPLVRHEPLPEVQAQKPFQVNATVAGIQQGDQLRLELRHSASQWKTMPMHEDEPYRFSAEVPAEMAVPGLIQYRIILETKEKELYVFPGGIKGDPYAWDEYRYHSWATFVAPAKAPLILFDPNTDQQEMMVYNPDWRNNSISYTTIESAQQLALNMQMNKPQKQSLLAFQFYFKDKISGRNAELNSFTQLVVKAAGKNAANVKVSLITKDAMAYSAIVDLQQELMEIEIPLTAFQQDAFLLLPRPYPGFLPLYFQGSLKKDFDLAEVEKIEISFSAADDQPASVQVRSVWLKQ